MTFARWLTPLVLAAGVFAVGVTSAQPPAPPPAAAPLPLVPKTAVAFITLRISDLVDHPDMKGALAQLAEQTDALEGITKVIGAPLADIDRLTLFWPRLTPHDEEPILVVTTRKPFNEARVLKALGAEPMSGTGKSGDPLLYELSGPAFQVLLVIDDRTLMLLPHPSNSAHVLLLAAALNKNATGPLADALAGAGEYTFAMGVNLVPVFQEFGPRDVVTALPDLFRDFNPKDPLRELLPYKALRAARSAVVTGTLGKDAKLALRLDFEDAAAARRAAPVLEEGIAAVATWLRDLADEFKVGEPSFRRSAVPLVTALAAGLKRASVKIDGAALTAGAEVEVGPAAAKALGEYLSVIGSRRKYATRTHNLKQIGIALWAYYANNKTFPTNVYGPKGEPLLSWRVHLLPYLEYGDLYNQIDIREPWNGPTNKKFIDETPPPYIAPYRTHTKGKTYYQSFIGSAKDEVVRPWLRPGERVGLKVNEVSDGLSKTLAVVEAHEDVVWSKPDDLPFGGAVPALGEKGARSAPVLWFDGSARSFPTDLTSAQFWPYVTINGREEYHDPEYWLIHRDRAPKSPLADPPAANDPSKPPLGAGAVGWEERVADRKAVLLTEIERGLADALAYETVLRARTRGAATEQEVAKAKAGMDAALARIQAREHEWKQAQREAGRK